MGKIYVEKLQLFIVIVYFNRKTSTYFQVKFIILQKKQYLEVVVLLNCPHPGSHTDTISLFVCPAAEPEEPEESGPVQL